MSAFGPKRTCVCARLMPFSGVERPSALHCAFLRLTQSGHRVVLNERRLNHYDALSRTPGGAVRRLEFIRLLVAAAPTWPLATRAQQPTKTYRIGMLETVSPALNTAELDAFRKGLRELGYVEGQTYKIEYRSADGQAERFPELAKELV